MRRLSIATVLLLLSACASFNDALTPSAKVLTDDFDGSIIIRQPPVSAAASVSEAWHTLGFEWVKKYPNVVYITVGTAGITNVSDVAFNVDGKIVTNIKKASTLTEYGDWSTRRMIMTLSDFKKVATGKAVKMKVTQIDEYTVSSFGSSKPSATVNKKFQPFLELITQNQ